MDPGIWISNPDPTLVLDPMRELVLDPSSVKVNASAAAQVGR